MLLKLVKLSWIIYCMRHDANMMFLVYTLSEVEDHDTEDDCWMVIHEKVYNVTKFVNEHPGGMIITVRVHLF